jgi:putative peptidoglycan lipid II flippase
MIKQTLFLSGINLSGKLLGLLKIIILASIYGAGSVYDAYIIAYTLPTVLPQILTTIITTIFIPQFHKKSRVSKESWEGLNVLFTFVVTLSFTLTLVLYVYAGSIVPMLAPGADSQTLEMAISLFKVMSISTFIIGISSFFIALSNATEKFYLASIDSLIINSIVITYCFIFSDESNIETITYLLIIGFCIHLFVMIYSNRVVVLSKIRFNLNYKHEDFKNPMSKSIPIVVGYVGAVSSGIVDQWFSSYEDIGSISVLSYAAMLYLLPMEVFGKAIMQTYFTKFSSLSNDKARLIKSYNEGIKLILFIIIPVSLY